MLEQYENFSKAIVSGNYSALDSVITISGNDIYRLPNSGSGVFSVVWYNATDYPSVYNDPNKEICRVTGFSGNSLYLERGREYTSPVAHSGENKTFKIIATPTARGFNNLYHFRNPEKSYYYFFDWISSISFYSEYGWATAQSAGTASFVDYEFGPHFGVIKLAAGVNDGNRYVLSRGEQPYSVGDGLFVFETMARLDVLPNSGNNYFAKFGFAESENEYQSANFIVTTGGLTTQTSAAAIETQNLTAFVMDTGWHKYNIVIKKDASAVDFYVDDIFVATNTSNIPNSTFEAQYLFRRDGTMTDTSLPRGGLYVDYTLIYKELAGNITGHNYRII